MFSEKEDNEQPRKSATFQTFATHTTLHGIKGIVAPRIKYFKFIWLLCLLGSFAFYIYLLQRSVTRYYSYPYSTVYRQKYVTSLDFPAVSICSPMLFQASKMNLQDNDTNFKTYGLDIPACTETRNLRSVPCGEFWYDLLFTGAIDSLDRNTTDYLEKLLNVTEFIIKFAVDFDPRRNAYCSAWKKQVCDMKYISKSWTPRGFCYTINSAEGNSSVFKVDQPGRAGSLFLAYDIRELERYPLYSEKGFVVILHRPGEHFDPEQEGFYTTPGAQSQILIHTEKVINLELPYATNCTNRKLKEARVYTQNGCRQECHTQYNVKICGCKLPLSKGSPEASVCSLRGLQCVRKYGDGFHYDMCDCPVACNITKYKHSISFYQKPSSLGEGKTAEYIRTNIVSMELRFDDLSYTEYEQTKTYDVVSLLAELGGNMGLFLGCSILTFFEFIEFILSLCAARKKTEPKGTDTESKENNCSYPVEFSTQNSSL